MDEEDFLELIKEMERQLRAHDSADIADPSHYTWRDTETGEVRLHEGRKRLILMLEAFSRKLAIEDRATYERALGQINEVLHDKVLSGAEVETLDGERISLSEASDLTEIRQELNYLIDQIREAPERLR